MAEDTELNINNNEGVISEDNSSSQEHDNLAEVAEDNNSSEDNSQESSAEGAPNASEVNNKGSNVTNKPIVTTPKMKGLLDLDELSGEGEDKGVVNLNKKDEPKEGEDKVTKEEDKETPEAEEDLKEEEPAPKKGRDYTNLPPAVVKALKGMNNQQYAKVAPAIRSFYDEAVKAIATATEVKKAAEAKGPPSSWYENPNAYQLTEDYQTNARELGQIDRESRFYQQQLINIKSGKEYQIITGYDAQGNALLSQLQKPTNEAEVLIADGLQDLRAQRNQKAGAINELQRSFKDRYTRSAASIKEQVDSFINKMEEGLKPDPAKVKLMLDAIAPEHRNHPLAYGYGQMFGVLIKQAEEIQRLRGIKTNEARINNDKRRAGPATNNMSRSANQNNNGTIKINGKNHPKIFDLEELE